MNNRILTMGTSLRSFAHPTQNTTVISVGWAKRSVPITALTAGVQG
jgi:hypothetical protein